MKNKIIPIRVISTVTMLLIFLLFGYLNVHAANDTETVYREVYYPTATQGHALPQSSFASSLQLTAEGAGGTYSTDTPSYSNSSGLHISRNIYYTWCGTSEIFDLNHATSIKKPGDVVTIYYSDGTNETITGGYLSEWSIPEGHKTGTAYVVVTSNTKYAATHSGGVTPSESYTHSADHLQYAGYISPVKITYEIPKTPVFTSFSGSGGLTTVENLSPSCL